MEGRCPEGYPRAWSQWPPGSCGRPNRLGSTRGRAHFAQTPPAAAATGTWGGCGRCLCPKARGPRALLGVLHRLRGPCRRLDPASEPDGITVPARRRRRLGPARCQDPLGLGQTFGTLDSVLRGGGTFLIIDVMRAQGHRVGAVPHPRAARGVSGWRESRIGRRATARRPMRFSPSEDAARGCGTAPTRWPARITSIIRKVPPHTNALSQVPKVALGLTGATGRPNGGARRHGNPSPLKAGSASARAAKTVRKRSALGPRAFGT